MNDQLENKIVNGQFLLKELMHVPTIKWKHYLAIHQENETTYMK